MENQHVEWEFNYSYGLIFATPYFSQSTQPAIPTWDILGHLKNSHGKSAPGTLWY